MGRTIVSFSYNVFKTRLFLQSCLNMQLFGKGNLYFLNHLQICYFTITEIVILYGNLVVNWYTRFFEFQNMFGI